MGYIIKLIPVKDLVGKKFIIPAYQRGYKWTRQQVKDLLNDIYDFTFNESRKDGFLCLQPLAVARIGGFEETIRIEKNSDEETILSKVREAFNKNVEWAVIDGQQRLTTIKLIMTYLNSKLEGNENLYDLEYKTRKDSASFLNGIAEKNENDATNSDYYHMFEVYKAIKEFFEGKYDDKLANIKKTILENTQFIWYECPKNDEIKVFTDLNKGKIKLTNAELIKALFLNASNFVDSHRQHEIASEWDEIERSLQNDEFWLFFHDNNYSNPTRIDYLFDVMHNWYLDKIVTKKRGNQKKFQIKVKDDINSIIGKDEYRTFRFYEYLIERKNKEYEKLLLIDECTIDKLWGDVKELYYTLREWYNDLYFYHDIGFLVECDHKKIEELYKNWKNKNKEEFRKWLVSEIKDIINKNCKPGEKPLDILYELDDGDSKRLDKTKCRPILLIHNIQTVINQNKRKRGDDQYKYEVFYKFPFYLIKRDKWDVEHIDSNTTNNISDTKSRLVWFLQFKNNVKIDFYIEVEQFIINKIISNKKEGNCYNEKEILEALGDDPFNIELEEVHFNDFSALYTKICNLLVNETDKLEEGNERNQIWNFTLLDSSTNRGYGNSLFPSKRRTIMAKERRQKINLKLVKPDKGEWQFVYDQEHNENVTTFIPPVTRNVFMKYYTPEANSFECWTKDDAKAYKEDIEETLNLFLKKKEN